MSETTLLPIGRIRNAHGIKGEVCVDYYADSPLLLQEGAYLRSKDGDPVFHKVTSFRKHHGFLLVLFADSTDRNVAETLRGREVLIPQSRLPKPDEGEIYIYQLMGLAVLAVEPDSPNGSEKNLGIISSVDDQTGQELWTISKPGEADILFPATSEFVLDFDLENNTVRIAPPPGLVDLYRP